MNLSIVWDVQPTTDGHCQGDQYNVNMSNNTLNTKVTYLTMGRTTPLPSVAWPFQLRAPTKYTWGPSSPTTTGARLPDSELTQVTIAEAFHIYISHTQIYIYIIHAHIYFT